MFENDAVIDTTGFRSKEEDIGATGGKYPNIDKTAKLAETDDTSV